MTTTCHPILFSYEMVQAILDRRKTVTRRPVRRQGDVIPVAGTDLGGYLYRGRILPYGRPGDLLWVRETWAPDPDTPGEYLYRADYEPDSDIAAAVRWRPAIHMPRIASRITLEVTNLHVERLDTWLDATEEGFSTVPKFLLAWNEMYEKKGFSWDTSPLVWVVRFKMTKNTPQP